MNPRTAAFAGGLLLMLALTGISVATRTRAQADLRETRKFTEAQAREAAFTPAQIRALTGTVGAVLARTDRAERFATHAMLAAVALPLTLSGIIIFGCVLPLRSRIAELEARSGERRHGEP